MTFWGEYGAPGTQAIMAKLCGCYLKEETTGMGKEWESPPASQMCERRFF